MQSGDVTTGYRPADSGRRGVTITRSARTETAGTPERSTNQFEPSGRSQSARTIERETVNQNTTSPNAPERAARTESFETGRAGTSPATTERAGTSRELTSAQRSPAGRSDSKETADRTRSIQTDRFRSVPDKSVSRAEISDAQQKLRQDTGRRARLAGTERISARPSEAYRNKPVVMASETRTRSFSVPENTSQIVINGDNNVIVQGNITTHRPRPYISPRLYGRDVFNPHRHRSWHDHGWYFSFGWSSSSCGRVIWAPYRSHWGFSYYYPRYHRKYVFVSVGGFWPTSYRYRRYYWYGCHPNYWYGTHIIEQPVVQNTYNTYNYYGTGGTTVTTTNVYDNPPLTQSTDVVDVIDAPTNESVVDICFAHGVKVFGDGNYTEAVERFRRAVQMDPEDVILPFTYSQALFAEGDYALSAGVLRGAIQNIPEDELTIYYPRGLYEDEAVLSEQIQRLESAIAGEPFVSDYQLLLGYQYLGLGELQKARGPLTEASKDIANQFTAGKLLELADRLEAEQAQIEK